MRRLILGFAVAAATLIPNFAMADDQAIASQIMSRLQVEQQRGTLKGFQIDMRVDQGTVWYKGYVSNQTQKDLILRTAQEAQSLGVVQVVDDISVRDSAPVAQQTAYIQENAYAPVAQPQMNIPSPQQPAPAYMGNAGIQGAPMAMNAGMNMPAAGDAASLPNYAWPSYAAHPNYAAVSYPGQYSASAWPYIGPFYPYPQVPLGWRKVTMEWDDGWWWLDFHSR
jgi:BON domain